jgi:hypothetical protein
LQQRWDAAVYEKTVVALGEHMKELAWRSKLRRKKDEMVENVPVMRHRVSGEAKLRLSGE